MTGSGLGTFGSQAGVGDRLLTNGPHEPRTNGVSGWAIIRFWQHSTANHSRHSSRLIGPPLTATEEWKDAGWERINGSLWKREPWFSSARKASWNDDCGRPAFSELFGIPNRIWIPLARIFAVLGNFLFSPFFLGSL